jgi:hypothetical protein
MAAALSPGLATGVSSCIYFVFLTAAGSGGPAALLDSAFWSAAIAFLLVDRWKRTRRRLAEDPDRPARQGVARSPASTRAVLAAAAALVTLGALAAASFWVQWATEPHGEWDAWAIWNLRARAIWRAGPDWPAVLSPDIAWSWPDYPLLVPLTIARLWQYAGADSTAVPALVAGLFALASITTLTVAIGQTCGWTAGLLSGAILMASRTFLFQAGSQCADVPLAFFVLAAVSLVVSSGSGCRARRSILMAAGLAAGLAAWTKNDGLLLLMWMVAFLVIFRRRFGVEASRHFAAGAALPLAVLAWFKLSLAPANDLLGPHAMRGALARVTDETRWAILLERTTEMLRAWGGTRVSVFLILALTAALLAQPSRLGCTRMAQGLLLVATLMAGFLVVYVSAPTSLATMTWHVSTSFDRLVTQLWPATVWSVFQLSYELEERPGQLEALHPLAERSG